jgi:hypothetical protein
MILVVQILMEVIINGEIISDMQEVYEVGVVFLLESGQNENSDHVQMDIMYQISQI